MNAEAQARITMTEQSLRVARLEFKELTPYHWRVPAAGVDVWPTTLRAAVTDVPDLARQFASVNAMVAFVKRFVEVRYL